MKAKSLLGILLISSMFNSCENPEMEGYLVKINYQGGLFLKGNEKYTGFVEVAPRDSVKVIYHKERAIKAKEDHGNEGEKVKIKKHWFWRKYVFIEQPKDSKEQ